MDWPVFLPQKVTGGILNLVSLSFISCDMFVNIFRNARGHGGSAFVR